MIKHNQNEAGNVLVTVSLSFFLVIVLVFGIWAFAGRQDYKNNTDAKITAAVAVAKQQEDTSKDAQFAQESKNPLRTYNGPQAYGSLVIKYPNTWSGYVDSNGSGSAPLDGYFYPGIVPAIGADSSVFALRVQVLPQSYSQAVQAATSGTGQVVSAYALPQVPKTVGVKVTGTLPDSSKTGTLVILPLRDQALEIWTEGTQFTDDFNNSILPNFSFSP